MCLQLLDGGRCLARLQATSHPRLSKKHRRLPKKGSCQFAKHRTVERTRKNTLCYVCMSPCHTPSTRFPHDKNVTCDMLNMLDMYYVFLYFFGFPMIFYPLRLHDLGLWHRWLRRDNGWADSASEAARWEKEAGGTQGAMKPVTSQGLAV